MLRTQIISAVALLLLAPALTPVGAAERGHDHPLVGRFQGAEISNYEQKDFDEYPLIIRKAGHYGGISKNADAIRAVEGKITRITYRSDKKYSTLEVFRAYRETLAGKDFELLFECADAECGGRDFNHASPGYRFSSGAFAENYSDQRYLAAHLPRDQGDAYVAVQTARATSIGGVNKNAVYTQVDVVELRPRTSKVVVIKADKMGERISAEGKVVLYGLYFDTDSARIKPASEPTLNEIAKLLESKPQLDLLVVGHTDNQGAFDYNIDLSKRRAGSVVDVLVTEHGIARSRLKPWGVGFTAPAATNATEAGRAKNRRVELVER